MPAAPKDALLKSYVPADLAEEVERVAALRNWSVSQVIREALQREVPGAIYPEDGEMMVRLMAGDPAAREELLGLNVASLVQRLACRDEAAGGATLAYAVLASPERNLELIRCLVAAVDDLSAPGCVCADSVRMGAESRANYMARVRASMARAAG